MTHGVHAIPKYDKLAARLRIWAVAILDPDHGVQVATSAPTATACAAVRAVYDTRVPSEYRWCSPCGRLLTDSDPCFIKACQVPDETIRIR